MAAFPPYEVEEDVRQVPAPLPEFVRTTGCEQPAPVEHRIAGADLFGHLQDVRREEDRVPPLHVLDQELLDLVLDDRIEVDERLVDQGEPGGMKKGLREHQFLARPPREVLAEDVPLVPEVQKVEPPLGGLFPPGKVPDGADEPEVFGGAVESYLREVKQSWPQAEIAVMGAEGAANIVFKKEIEQAEDKEAVRRQKIEEYQEAFANPYVAASRGFVDRVIFPEETRREIYRALLISETKRELRPKRKHGIMPN